MSTLYTSSYTHTLTHAHIHTHTHTHTLPLRCVGWEKNAHSKLVPRVIDLSSMMSPVHLANTSVDLNLKLMRWRLLPSLNLHAIHQQRCLLLGTTCVNAACAMSHSSYICVHLFVRHAYVYIGAGTLGCNIARVLLAWGMKHITFVDNGTVSYSNPVRQSLYTHDDCVMKSMKATAASDALRVIFPSVVSVGVNMTIPMAGHR